MDFRTMSFSTAASTVSDRARQLFPGVACCLALAMAATFVSDHYGGPTLLFALLFGIALHFLSQESVAAAGVAWTARSVLRFGVALLGARISIGEIIELGLLPVALVIVGVVSTILFGRYAASAFGLSREQGVLTGGSVAICGASAALAISAVLPPGRESERNTLFTIIAVTTFSTVAMIVYPLISEMAGLDRQMAGIFIGGTIHDVAQVVAAGHMISDETGVIATFVKLMRVAMLVPAVLVIGAVFAQARRAAGGDTGKGGPALPGFLIAFVALAALNSTGIIPPALSTGLSDLSRWCLVTAIAALGIKTSLQEMARLGWRPVALVALETVWLAALVLIVLLLAA